MLPQSLCKSTVTVLRPSKTEVRGSMVPNWDNPERHELRGCSIQMSTTSSDLGARDNVQTQAILYAQPNADIQKGDRIEHNGRLYLVDGHPMLNGEGLRLEHLTVRLICWEG